MRNSRVRKYRCGLLGLALAVWSTPPGMAQEVTYKPYIELGDAGSFGASDQIVVTWQTNESSPTASRSPACSDGRRTSSSHPNSVANGRRVLG